MWFYMGLGAVIVLAVCCWFGIKKAYDKGKTLPLPVSIAIWMLDTVHFILVLSASLYGVWLLPFNRTVTLIGGLIIGGSGFIIMLAGMIEFRSFQRMSGLDTSNLVITGIYKWSRNPQYAGWFLVLLGISFMGRSGLALSLTIALIIGIHLYNIILEEPYLERIFGEEYCRYKSSAPRYLGIPKRKRQ